MSKKELLAAALERTGLGALLSGTFSNWNGLLVFNYHRVGQPDGSPFDHALWSATQDQFSQQVAFLKKNFDVIGVDDLETFLSDKERRGVMLTFDDGYRDNYELALPVLRNHNCPATFFITSGFLDDRRVAWWDEIAWMVRSSPLEEIPEFTRYPETLPCRTQQEQALAVQSLLLAYKQLPQDQTTFFLKELAENSQSGRCPADVADELWMTWDMVREMDRSGMSIGGHTVSHPILSRTRYCDQQEEIFVSKHRIEAELGHPITAFSYPVGQRDSFNADTKALLQAAGYRWAFSFFGGFCPLEREDRFDLPRVAVSSFLSQQLFQATARFPWLFAKPRTA